MRGHHVLYVYKLFGTYWNTSFLKEKHFQQKIKFCLGSEYNFMCLKSDSLD
jgi:hypothetical protein